MVEFAKVFNCGGRASEECRAGREKHQLHKGMSGLNSCYQQGVCPVSGLRLTRILPPGASWAQASLSIARLWMHWSEDDDSGMLCLSISGLVIINNIDAQTS